MTEGTQKDFATRARAIQVLVTILVIVGIGVIFYKTNNQKIILEGQQPQSPISTPLKVIWSIDLNPPVKATQSNENDVFTFDTLTLYEFLVGGSADLNNCLPMREWDLHKAYFSCGKKEQQVLALEGNYTNNFSSVMLVGAGEFRIKLGNGTYLEQGYTTKDQIRVESGVSYTFRVSFENTDIKTLLPKQFTIEYDYNSPLPKSILVDSTKGTALTTSTNLPSVHNIIPTNYDVQSPSSTTTPLEFAGINFVAPWSGVVKTRVTGWTGTWNFKNGEFVFITVSTTTLKSTWLVNPDVKKIFPLDSLSDYDLEKMVWESDAQDAELLLKPGEAKTTDDVRKGMLASIKVVKYSRCEQLLEFQNQNGVKGVICRWHDKGEQKTVISFYPYDATEYSLTFTDQDSVRDSIISSIQTK